MKKKHPRLPSGYGSIRYLGKNRTLPYAVHPPAVRVDGIYKRPAALCYVPDWYTGFAVLAAYKAGTYTPGMEVDMQKEVTESDNLDAFCRRVLRSVAIYSRSEGLTLEDVYKSYIDYKFGANAPKKLSVSSKWAVQAGWRYLEPLHHVPIDTITVIQLQDVVNKCDKSEATREHIVNTIKQIWKYALSREMCEKDVARYVVVPDSKKDEHGVPFSDAELDILWKNKNIPMVGTILIMCYSGFRIGALETLEVNLKKGYFRGGLKTAAGKGRIVPIHSAIMPLLAPGMHVSLLTPPKELRSKMYKTLNDIGIQKHTPHDCRHTFSRLCEKYHVSEADRKRMLGHSFGNDITNGVYGHRTLEELREEIEKIKVVGICGQ